MKSTLEILPYLVAVLLVGGVLYPVDAAERQEGRSLCTCSRRAATLNSTDDLNDSGRFSKPPPTPPSNIAGRLGVHAGLFPFDLTSVESLKPSFVRVGGLRATDSASYIQSLASEYANRGASMIALVDFNFNNDLPDDNGARNVGTWATVSNLAAIEYGNEPYLQDIWEYEEYARSFKIANDAVLAANPSMTLIAAADTANRNQRPGFQVLCALKCLGVRPRAIQIHPYGPDYLNRLRDTRDDLMAVDADWSDMDIWVTEVGIATDNGVALVPNNYGWATDLTYSEAATILETIVNDLLDEDNVKKVVIYRGTDNNEPGATNNREDYFGLLLNGANGAKGALTTMAINLLDLYRSP